MAEFSETDQHIDASWLLFLGLLLVNVGVFAFFMLAERGTGAEVVPASASESDARALILISELDPETLERMRVPRTESAAAAPETSQALGVCRAWGPFANDEALSLARSAVAPVSDAFRVVRRQVAGPPDYLVYLDSDNNPDNARRLVGELKSQQIDAYVLAGGPYVNSVSAGVFSSRESAEALAARLANLGFEPQMRELPRVQEIRYLLARVPDDFEIAGMEPLPCAEIAPSGQFL